VYPEILDKNSSNQSVNKSYYEITRDGFTFLAMGFTGKKAAQLKEMYIDKQASS
jgi:Rha family phage regulatory protein